MTKLVLLANSHTDLEANEITGRVLLARIMRSLQSITIIDNKDKLELVMKFETLCKCNINKSRDEFCLLMWEQLEQLKTLQDNDLAELSAFRIELGHMSHAMKILTKGNINESTNH